MDPTNKARNTMIRNARKRLKERELLDESGKDKAARVSSGSHSDKVSEHGKPGQFLRTFSVVTEDGDDGKKVKVDVPFLMAAKNDCTPQDTVKIRGAKDTSKREALKFKLKQDKTSKIQKNRKKDSSLLKVFAKRNDIKAFNKKEQVKSAVKQKESRTKHERSIKSDWDDSGCEITLKSHGNKLCAEKCTGDTLPENDLVSISTALSGMYTFDYNKSCFAMLSVLLSQTSVIRQEFFCGIS